MEVKKANQAPPHVGLAGAGRDLHGLISNLNPVPPVQRRREAITALPVMLRRRRVLAPEADLLKTAAGLQPEVRAKHHPEIRGGLRRGRPAKRHLARRGVDFRRAKGMTAAKSVADRSESLTKRPIGLRRIVGDQGERAKGSEMQVRPLPRVTKYG